MKVTYVTMNWPASSETFIVRDILALKRSAVEVEVFGLKVQKNNCHELLKKMGAESIEGKSPNLFQYFSGLIYGVLNLKIFIYLLMEIHKETLWRKKIKGFVILPSIFWCIKRILKTNPDVVHLFWGHYPSLLALGLKRIEWKGVVSMFLGAYDLAEKFGPSLKAAIKSDLLFTHAKANLDILEQEGYPSGEFHVVYRGVDTNEIEKHVNIHRKNRQIIVVSRLIPEKNVDKVIDSFALIKNEYPTSSLVIVGDGADSENLIEKVKTHNLEDSVTFSGYLPPEKVFEKLYESSMFLFLSTKPGERLPNAVKEAMLAGAVPVTCFTPGMDELIINGVDGYIVSGVSSKEVLDAVKLLWGSNKERVIAENAKRKVKATFNVENSMKIYSKLWRQALKNKV